MYAAYGHAGARWDKAKCAQNIADVVNSLSKATTDVTNAVTDCGGPNEGAACAVARAKHELPDGHSAHAVRPRPGWYLPRSHAAQMLAPSVGVIVPASHAVAAVAPVAHAEAGRQGALRECVGRPRASSTPPGSPARRGRARSAERGAAS